MWGVLLTLIVPIVWAHLPPSPAFPGVGPLPGAPPPLVYVDRQRCLAMKKEVRRAQVPIPYFCHPRDPKGIPVPPRLDKQILMVITRLQWSGYKVCKRMVPMPMHRYIPTPVCCPGWRRGKTGECDTPIGMATPPIFNVLCVHGGIPMKTGRCHCPPGYIGVFCQWKVPTSLPPLRPPMPKTFPNPIRFNPLLDLVPKMQPPFNANKPRRVIPKLRPIPISSRLLTIMINKQNRTPVRPSYRGVNLAYVNSLSQKPVRPFKPSINPTSINKVPRYLNPRRPAINVAYINQVTEVRQRARMPNLAYINRIRGKPYILKPQVNHAYVNRLGPAVPREPVVNLAYINRIRENVEPAAPVSPPDQTAYVNQVPEEHPQFDPVIIIPPNTPRPVIAPPVAPEAPELKPVATPGDQKTEDDRGMDSSAVRGTFPGTPGLMGSPLTSGARCQQIIEVGVTRCFRDAGILAAPADVFNPQNPGVSRRICSQGGRLRPCIMAGETACGRGMRVIITRRMLTSLLNAMGNLCTQTGDIVEASIPSRQSPPPENMCLNGGVEITSDNRVGCDCPPDFTGDICQTQVCSLTCENNGQCEIVDGVSRCSCPPGYSGDSCQEAITATTVEEPKPVDPATDSLETSPHPMVNKPENTENNQGNVVDRPDTKEVPVPQPTKNADQENRILQQLHREVQKQKLEVFGYPLWFVLAIILGILIFIFVICLVCCLCIKCRSKKQTFELHKETVKIPVLDNIYTVGVVPSVYESKGIPPLSYEEAKGETIKGDDKPNED